MILEQVMEYEFSKLASAKLCVYCRYNVRLMKPVQYLLL